MSGSYCIVVTKGEQFVHPRFLNFTWDVKDPKTGKCYLIIVTRAPSESDIIATIETVISGHKEIFITKTPREWITWKDMRKDPDISGRMPMSAAFDAIEIDTIQEIQNLYTKSHGSE